MTVDPLTLPGDKKWWVKLDAEWREPIGSAFSVIAASEHEARGLALKRLDYHGAIGIGVVSVTFMEFDC